MWYPKGPLFRTIGRGTGQFTRMVLPQANAYAIIGRRGCGRHRYEFPKTGGHCSLSY